MAKRTMGSALALVAIWVTPTASADVSPGALSEIDSYFKGEVLHQGFPGGSLAVFQDDRLVLTSVVGVADLDTRAPVTVDTAYCLGSVSKPFTATAVLQLRDQGRIELDAPVTRYLPWFRVADEGASDRITLRHLLTHTSGLPTNSHSVVWQDEAAIRGSIDQAVRALRGVHLRRPPGSAFEYANMNYVVLGRVIEQVSGLPWDRYLATNIFAPLGMSRTTTHAGPGDAPTLARPYAPEFGRLVAEPPQVGDFMGPASNVVSTATDLARFGAAHLGWGPALLQPRTLDEAHAGEAEKAPGVRYGLGWVDERYAGVRVIHHSGTTAHSAALYLVPERGLAIAVLFGAYSHLADEQIGWGVVSLALGRVPAAARGPTELGVLVWLERGLLGLILACPATLGVLPLARRRRWKSRSAGFRVTRAWALMALGCAAWFGVLWVLPGQIPEMPLPFGFHGWLPQLAVACGTVLVTATAWAAWGLFTSLEELPLIPGFRGHPRRWWRSQAPRTPESTAQPRGGA